jgi:GTP-binding protein
LEAVPFLYVSAITGQRVHKLLEAIVTVAEARKQRIATAEVNRALRGLVDRNQPPQAPGREVKLLYASQISSAPPTFAVVSNWPDEIGDSYQRYLINGFRAAWGFAGTPIRLKLRRKRGRS